MISIEIMMPSQRNTMHGPALVIVTVGIQLLQWVHGSETLSLFAALQEPHGTQVTDPCTILTHLGSLTDALLKQSSKVSKSVLVKMVMFRQSPSENLR